MRDMRNVDPGGVQPRTRDLLDARERDPLDWTEFGKVDLRHRGQRAAPRWRGSALGERCLQVLAGDAALFARALQLIEIEAKFARQPPNCGAGEDTREIRKGGARSRLRRPRRQIRWRNGRGLGRFRSVFLLLRVRLVLLTRRD